MMFDTLVIASHNANKVKEIGEMIAPLSIAVKSADELDIPEPEETGETFAANSELKAYHAAESCGLPSLADDSGLVVPALGGAPGIYSARWAGPNKDFHAAFARIQNELGDKPADAYFICDLCLCMPDGKVSHFEGRVDGKLTFPPRGDKGFGYDPIFIPARYIVTFGEMDAIRKNAISHRSRAFAKFIDFLKGLS